jgi:hypothetical protein
MALFDALSTSMWMTLGPSGCTALLLASGALAAGYFGYLLLRAHRARRPRGARATVRAEGRVARACALEGGATLLLIDHLGQRLAVVATPGVPGLGSAASGRWVTVDGAPVVTPVGEPPYRGAVLEGGVSASRILVGRWPELRWLRLPVALACVVFLLSLAELLFPPAPARLFAPRASSTSARSS